MSKAGLIEGSFAATGQSESFVPNISKTSVAKPFNIFLSGTAVASVQLEKSHDEGVTWFALYAAGTQLMSWSYSNAGSSNNIAETQEESETGIIYRLNCTSHTSGTLDYRLSQ